VNDCRSQRAGALPTFVAAENVIYAHTPRQLPKPMVALLQLTLGTAGPAVLEETRTIVSKQLKRLEAWKRLVMRD
jgi:hypothetical protein